MVYPKNVGDSVAMNFTYDRYSALMAKQGKLVLFKTNKYHF